MILNKILIDNCKCKMIFLLTGMKHTNDMKAVPRKYISELKQLSKDLKTYISPEEYIKFMAGCLDIELNNPVEQAEDIIKKFYEK